MAERPSLLLGSTPSMMLEEYLRLFERLSGRPATAAETEELKQKMRQEAGRGQATPPEVALGSTTTDDPLARSK
jgi:hypothetical protein